MEYRSTWDSSSNADHARIGLEALNNLRRILRFIGDELHKVNFGEKQAVAHQTWDYMKMARDTLDVINTTTMLCRENRIPVDGNVENWPF